MKETIDRRASDNEFQVKKQQKETTLEWHRNLTPESSLKDLIQESSFDANPCHRHASNNRAAAGQARGGRAPCLLCFHRGLPDLVKPTQVAGLARSWPVVHSCISHFSFNLIQISKWVSNLLKFVSIHIYSIKL
jgi:hypothetical protein